MASSSGKKYNCIEHQNTLLTTSLSIIL